jgi:hypothetical protein
MFCIGCARRLPTFVASGPSALESIRALPYPSSPRTQSRPPGPTLPAETPWFWLWLALLVLAMMMVFVGWYVSFTHTDAGPPAVASAGAAPESAVEPEAKAEAASVVEPGPGPLPSAAPAPASMPNAPAADPSHDAPAAPSPRRNDAPVEAVAKFYRVVPAKRGRGPFRAEEISAFYGSLREPLALRSIRTIDPNRVEVRYRYRAAKTPCEGIAIVETETVLRQTLIRRIRANC